MNNHTLKLENQAFRGTKGVSEINRSDGFKPAFLNQKTGRVELARFGNGAKAFSIPAKKRRHISAFR